MRLRRTLAVSTALLALVATGCSDDGSSDDESSDPVNPRESAAAQPAPEPAEGGGPTQFRPVLASGDEEPADGAEVDAGLVEEYASFECSEDVAQPKPADATIACDASGTKHLLAPAIEGVAVARAFPYEFADVLSVGIVLDGAAGPRLTKAAKQAGADRIALELGGVVIASESVGTMAGRGRTQVTGELDQDSAQALADRIASAQG